MIEPLDTGTGKSIYSGVMAGGMFWLDRTRSSFTLFLFLFSFSPFFFPDHIAFVSFDLLLHCFAQLLFPASLRAYLLVQRSEEAPVSDIDNCADSSCLRAAI